MPDMNSPADLARGLLQIQAENAVRIAAINTRAMLRLVTASLSAATSAAPGAPQTGVLNAAQEFSREAGRTLVDLWRDYGELASSTTTRSVQLLSGETPHSASELTARVEAPGRGDPKHHTVRLVAKSVQPQGETAPDSRQSAESQTGQQAPRNFEVLSTAEGVCFQLTSYDGTPVLTSRYYPDERSAKRGMQTVLKNAMHQERFMRKTDTQGQHFFELKAGNNRLLLTSALFNRANDLDAAIEILVQSATDVLH